MAHFILVHGAFDGAWCWTQTADDLRAAGHTVCAVDLPGAGDDLTPVDQVTLTSATDRVLAALRSQNPAILVGHSMGGIVITQAAAQAPTLITRLVYLTAFLPQDGQSLLDLTHLPEAAGGQVEEHLTVSGDPPIGTFDLTKARQVFYHDVPEDIAQHAIRKMGPQPLQLFDTPVALGHATLPPADYAICTQDRAIPPPLQRLMAKRAGARLYFLNSGHSPFYAVPQQVLNILNVAAASQLRSPG